MVSRPSGFQPPLVLSASAPLGQCPLDHLPVTLQTGKLDLHVEEIRKDGISGLLEARDDRGGPVRGHRNRDDPEALQRPLGRPEVAFGIAELLLEDGDLLRELAPLDFRRSLHEALEYSVDGGRDACGIRPYQPDVHEAGVEIRADPEIARQTSPDVPGVQNRELRSGAGPEMPGVRPPREADRRAHGIPRAHLFHHHALTGKRHGPPVRADREFVGSGGKPGLQAEVGK
jgi:hypothetical protein